MVEILAINLRYSSLFHLKMTVSVTKSLHQDHGLRYLHLAIFFLIHTLLFCSKIKSSCAGLHK